MAGISLRASLQEAGWSPRRLAVEINSALAARGRERDRIHPTTPYYWVGSGNQPNDASVAVAAAEVLSARVGRLITVAELWPEATEGTREPQRATHGLVGPWTSDAVLAALHDVSSSGTSYFPEQGPALVTAALDGLHAPPRPATQVVTGDRVLPPAVEVIRRHIAELRRLDDRTGGGPFSLRYVRAELRAVLELLRYATHSPQVGRELLRAAAELAQLAGWMWFDASDVGPAQRAFLLGLRLGSEAEDADGTVNMLGMLAYIAAHSGASTDAIRLADHALTQARKRGPVLHARVAGRLATAYAAAGDLYGYRSAAEHARVLLERPQLDQTPTFLYYFSTSQLEAESGQALVDLARHNPAHRTALLNEATTRLAPLTTAGPDADYQRSALLHGCYLAQAHFGRREVEQAYRVTRIALTRLTAVQSGRCTRLLKQLRTAFARRQRNPWAADVVRELDAALLKV